MEDRAGDPAAMARPTISPATWVARTSAIWMAGGAAGAAWAARRTAEIARVARSRVSAGVIVLVVSSVAVVHFVMQSVVVDASRGCRDEEKSNGFQRRELGLHLQVNVDCPFVKCGDLTARPKS